MREPLTTVLVHWLRRVASSELRPAFERRVLSYFRKPECSAGGAAIYNTTSATITNSTFSNNKALSGAGGGAIDTRGVMSITGSTFTATDPAWFDRGNLPDG